MNADLKQRCLTQSGPWIKIPSGTITVEQLAFRTKRHTSIDIFQRQRSHYLIRGYQLGAEKRLTVQIHSSHVNPGCTSYIEYRCACGSAPRKMQVRHIARGGACAECAQLRKAKKLTQSVTKIEKQFRVKFEKATGLTKRCVTHKRCGCSYEDIPSKLKIRNSPKCCEHDSIYLWQYIEIIVRNALRGNLQRIRGGYIDCVNPKVVVEIKSRADALEYYNRDIKNQLRKYRAWASKSKRQFFVVVNAPQKELIGQPSYILGWERWTEVPGLTLSTVRKAQRATARPRMYLRQIISQADRSNLRQFVRLSEKLGYLASDSEIIAAGLTTSRRVLSRIATGDLPNAKRLQNSIFETFGVFLPLHWRRRTDESDNEILLSRFRILVENKVSLPTSEEIKRSVGCTRSRISSLVTGKPYTSMSKIINELGFTVEVGRGKSERKKNEELACLFRFCREQLRLPSHGEWNEARGQRCGLNQLKTWMGLTKRSTQTDFAEEVSNWLRMKITTKGNSPRRYLYRLNGKILRNAEISKELNVGITYLHYYFRNKGAQASIVLPGLKFSNGRRSTIKRKFYNSKVERWMEPGRERNVHGTEKTN